MATRGGNQRRLPFRVECAHAADVPREVALGEGPAGDGRTSTRGARM